jgi:hypothetical protein
MAFYNGSTAGRTPAVGTWALGMRSTDTSMQRVVEWYLGGEATSSTVNRMTVARSTTVGTGSTTIVANKHNPRSPAAVATVITEYTTQPTYAAVALATLAFNAFGGVVRWVAAPGEEMYVLGTADGDEEISIRSAAGTGTLSADMHFEEL